MKMGLREANQRFSKAIKAVKAGEEVILTEHTLRTLDAIHVASALVYGDALGVRLPFVTADERQRDAAERLALDVVRVG